MAGDLQAIALKADDLARGRIASRRVISRTPRSSRIWAPMPYSISRCWPLARLLFRVSREEMASGATLADQHDHAPALAADNVHCLVHGGLATRRLRPEHVVEGVQWHARGRAPGRRRLDIALHQRHVLGRIDGGGIDLDVELAAIGACRSWSRRRPSPDDRSGADRRSDRRWCAIFSP